MIRWQMTNEIVIFEEVEEIEKIRIFGLNDHDAIIDGL